MHDAKRAAQRMHSRHSFGGEECVNYDACGIRGHGPGSAVGRVRDDMDEIRVRVTRTDIERAFDYVDDGHEHESNCALAQALMRLGYAAVEVYESDRIYIGMERYEAIDERPGDERLWKLIHDFDEANEVEIWPEPDEFVLRRRTQ